MREWVTSHEYLPHDITQLHRLRVVIEANMLMGSWSDLSDEVTCAPLANHDLYIRTMFPIQFTYHDTFFFFFPSSAKPDFQILNTFLGPPDFHKMEICLWHWRLPRGKSGQSGAECK